MAEVFEVKKAKIMVMVSGEIVEELVKELDLNTLKDIAKSSGIKKFTVRKDGVDLSAGDFPITADEDIVEVEIIPYYEAK